jgi:Mrp family chromosome partitioning ATPase
VSRRAGNVVRRARGLVWLAAALAAVFGAAAAAAAWQSALQVPRFAAGVAVVLLAVTLSAAFGLAREFRRPRVADLDEAARGAGATAFGPIRISAVRPSPDTGRRGTWQVADDPWQLALATITPLAGAGAWVIVSGDEPAETGASAAWLARAASEEPRSTLLVDTDPVTRAASAAFRPAPSAGVADVVADGRPWDDVLHAAFTGEFRALDVVAPGAARARAPRLSAADQAGLRATSARYGLTILTLPDLAALTAETPRGLEHTVALLVAVRGVTAVASLRRRAERLTMAGATIGGVILWEAPAG